MTRRLIAVGILTVAAALAVPSAASATTVPHHLTHLVKTLPAAPPYCC